MSCDRERWRLASLLRAPEPGEVLVDNLVVGAGAPELIESLCETFKKYPMLSFQAVNNAGKEFGNVKTQDVNAVT